MKRLLLLALLLAACCPIVRPPSVKIAPHVLPSVAPSLPLAGGSSNTVTPTVEVR